MEIELIDLEAEVAILSDGSTIPLTNFFDEDGDDCDPEDAVCCVAGNNDFGWLTISLADLDEPTFH